MAANEWGPLGIRVNALSPQASTPKTEAYFKLHPERLAEKLAQRPIRRDGDAERDIGRTVVFLAGPDSSFITGGDDHGERRAHDHAVDRLADQRSRAGRPQRWHAPPPASRSRWRAARDSAMI